MNKKLLIALPLLALLMFGCGPKKNTSTVAPTKKEIKTVKVFTARSEDFVRTRTISAETAAYQDITLSSETNGKVEWLKVSPGDSVFAGQLLARVDAKMAGAQYDVASANYNLAKSNYDRQSQLYDKKIISDMQYDQTKTQLETAKAGLELAAIQLQNTSVYSPIRGIIAAKFINENELINIGRPIIRIVNLDTIKIIIEAVEQDMINLKINQTVQIEIPSLGEAKYTGTISTIGSVADAKNKTFPVEITMSNPGHRIKAGMISSATFILDKQKKVIVIPQDLVIEGDNSKSIMIASGNVAILKPVQISQPEKGKVAIISGINPGEKIIFLGNKSVSSGDTVQVTEEANYANN